MNRVWNAHIPPLSGNCVISNEPLVKDFKCYVIQTSNGLPVISNLELLIDNTFPIPSINNF